MNENDIPITEWKENFSYDENSPSGLVRIYRNNGGICSKSAGSKKIGKNGKPDSWKFSFKNKQWRVHRIIWLLVHGNLKDGEIIDHIDRNPFNNSLNNLRAVSQEVNTRNRCMSRNNTTGVTGVWHRKVDNSFVAEWFDFSGKRFRKQFAIKKYGYNEALIMAQEFRNKALSELNEKDASIGYTETHGT